MRLHFFSGVSALLAVCLLANFADAQVRWTSLGSTSGVWLGSLTYDEVRDRVITLTAGGPWTTWEYDGSTWRQVPTATTPNGGAGSYDSTRQRVVFLSGGPGGTNDTWEYDGTAWLLVNTTSPWLRSPSYHHSLGRTLAFGGGTLTAPTTDLYEWNGANWTMISTTNQPPTWLGPRTQIVYGPMAYDERRDCLVLFGEFHLSGSIGSGPFAKTWEWDAVNGWSNPPAGGPNEEGELVFDRRRGVIMLLASNNTIWQWDGVGQWTQLTTGPTPPGGPVFLPAYDSTRGRTLMVPYDQQNPNVSQTLWALSPADPAAYDLHGAGCSGGVPGPDLDLAAPWTRAWLGSPWPFRVQLTGLPQSVAVLVTGLTDQIWLGTPLPLDLSGLGMPGCSLRVATEANVLAAGAAGTAEIALTLPPAAALLGQVFFQQGFALAPGANAAGVLATPSRRGVIGRW